MSTPQLCTVGRTTYSWASLSSTRHHRPKFVPSVARPIHGHRSPPPVITATATAVSEPGCTFLCPLLLYHYCTLRTAVTLDGRMYVQYCTVTVTVPVSPSSPVRPLHTYMRVALPRVHECMTLSTDPNLRPSRRCSLELQRASLSLSLHQEPRSSNSQRHATDISAKGSSAFGIKKFDDTTTTRAVHYICIQTATATTDVKCSTFNGQRATRAPPGPARPLRARSGRRRRPRRPGARVPQASSRKSIEQRSEEKEEEKQAWCDGEPCDAYMRFVQSVQASRRGG